MSLQDKLNAYKAEFESKTPPEKLAIMHRATEDLRRSGILDRGNPDYMVRPDLAETVAVLKTLK